MELLDELNTIIYQLEWKQRNDLLHATDGYRDELKQVYAEWLQEFLNELEDTPEEDRHEYIAVALLLLGQQVKEIQRLRLLEAFEFGLDGDPASPEALEELAAYISTQEEYIDTSLIPYLEAQFLDGLAELSEIGQEKFEEGLAKRAHRVGLYAVGFWAVSQAVQAWLSPPDRRCTWHLDPQANHCPDCPELVGEWTAATLPTRPGWGDTECGPGCRCWLTWSDPLEIWP